MFKQSSKTSLKEDFKISLEKIDERSFYAKNWLPDDFKKRRVTFFSKKDYSQLIESSLESGGEKAISFFRNMDEVFVDIISNQNEDKVKALFFEEFQEDIGYKYGEKTKINQVLCGDDGGILDSVYYSALLKIIEKKGGSVHKKYALALMKIFIGAHGKKFIEDLNEKIFSGDDFPIRDEIGDIFDIRVDDIGELALDLLLNDNKMESMIQPDDDVGELFLWAFHRVLKKLVSEFLSYQGLIDGCYKNLFSPKNGWSKFTKIVLFLNAAKNYIERECPDVSDIKDKSGYYHDIIDFSSHFDLCAVGTSNYTNILSCIMGDNLGEGGEVFYLNGCVDDYYNPYKNAIYSTDECENKSEIQDQLLVPFMFTQSGVKPLTSIKMSERYVKYFGKLQNSDAIICVGFGFNQDDGHINGMFRELLELGKRIFIVDVYNGKSEEEMVRKKINSLRASESCKEKLNVILVQNDRKNFSTGKNWLEEIISRID